jgi:hypothetical protein
MTDHDDHIGVDRDGQALPHTPAEIKAIVDEMASAGELVLVMIRHRDALAVKVFREPSLELADEFDLVAKQFRLAAERYRATRTGEYPKRAE